MIDVGTRIGAPFCAGLLGEMGAEVIKVEDPRGGDFMRTIGPFVNERREVAVAGGDGDGTPEGGDGGGGGGGVAVAAVAVAARQRVTRSGGRSKGGAARG